MKGQWSHTKTDGHGCSRSGWAGRRPSSWALPWALCAPWVSTNAAAQAELSSLLHLPGCCFEAPPFSSSLERLERSGALPANGYRKSGFELPGQGRFVLDPTPETPVPPGPRVLAVAIAADVGAVLAAPMAHGEREERTP